MSNSQKVERKLAAIMFTDIAGYTESMSYDESQAITAVKKKRSIIQPLIKDYNGIFVKEIGDGTLSYFSSAIDASTCAVKLQELTYDEEHLNIRVGLHIGDIVFDGQDVFGEGVNIASRLESLSPVGGVCVSKTVYDELENKKEFNGTSLGLQSLKGVGRLVEVFALKGEKLKEPDTSKYKETEVQKHTDDEVPSIAIIPFTNKGADEDVFYAYGISSDLISDCSSAGLIRVASLSDIEKIDYTNLDNTQLSQKLFVRYVSQGFLWKIGDIFQLSVELYDTKDKKVIWSDRWQEKWDNLPMIKGSLSDGLLKALNTKPKEVPKLETTNTEAYEIYLKAKHIYDKRKNTDDTKKARELLNKSIKLDDNLISAKLLLGTTYREMGDYDKAMFIFTPALEQAEKLDDKHGMGGSLSSIGLVHVDKVEYDKALDCHDKSLNIREALGDKYGMGRSLNNIGLVYTYKSEFEKALDYFSRSLATREELGDKHGIGQSLANTGLVHLYKGDLDKALEYYKRSLALLEELGNKHGMGYSLNNIGYVYHYKGDLDKALEYCKRSLTIREEIGDKYGMGYSLNYIGSIHSTKGDDDKALDCYTRSLTIREELGDKDGMGRSLSSFGLVYAKKGDWDKALDHFKRSLALLEELGDKRGMGFNLVNIGGVYYNRGEYNRAAEYLQKSLTIKKAIGVGADDLIWANTYLYLTYKHLNKDYDINEIYSLIKDADNIEFDTNFRLYQLLEDISYLETAYTQVQEKASAMEKELAEKFLNYPIQKQILEEWNKINN